MIQAALMLDSLNVKGKLSGTMGQHNTFKCNIDNTFVLNILIFFQNTFIFAILFS